jgi:hypothetical protein
MPLRTFALASLLVAAAAAPDDYSAQNKASNLAQLRATQVASEDEAAADCSKYPLAQPMKDCAAGSACHDADVKWAAEAASFLKSAKAEWSKILTNVKATTGANETLASYNGNLKTIQTRLHQLDIEKVSAEQGEAAAAAADQQRVKYAQDALTTVSRLKNYVQLADSVDSSHDFVVPLYNIQGKDPEVNGMIGGVIKVLLGQISAADKKAVYTSEFVRVEADLIKLMKGIYEDAPKSRMEYQTVTMPHLAQSISTANLELKEMQEKVSAVKHMVQAKTKGMEVDKTYHAVLLQRYEQAQASRVENTKQCAARMKSYAAASQRRNDEIKVLETVEAPTPAQLAAKVQSDLETKAKKEADKAKPFSCPRSVTCTGTIDNPCQLPWSDVHGHMYCVYAVTTSRRQENTYQQPGWQPIYPSCIAEDAVGCMLRNNAQLTTVKNPSTSLLANYNNGLLSKFKAGSFNPTLKTRDEIEKENPCEQISEAQLNKAGDACFTAGCGLTADTPCYKEWTGATGAKVCLLSKPTDSRDGTDKQNPGWLPVCPATVMGEMHACAPKALGSSVCNPHMNLVDVVQQTADQNGVAPVDCKLTEWGQWSACSKTCGMGHRFRQRGIVQAAQGSGAQCEDLLEKVACDSKRECPLPGGNTCSHVVCSMREVNVVDKETGAVVKHRYVKVSHHNKEKNGIAHHCAFNAYSAACNCVCHHGAEYVSPLYNPAIKT